MIREEFSFYDIADYLYKNNDLLIVGAASEDERSHYLFKEWNARGKDILVAKRVQDEKLHYSLWQKKSEVCSGCIDLCMGTPKLLQYLNVAQKSVLLDMSSLDHVLIMFLCLVRFLLHIFALNAMSIKSEVLVSHSPHKSKQ